MSYTENKLELDTAKQKAYNRVRANISVVLKDAEKLIGGVSLIEWLSTHGQHRIVTDSAVIFCDIEYSRSGCVLIPTDMTPEELETLYQNGLAKAHSILKYVAWEVGYNSEAVSEKIDAYNRIASEKDI